MLHDLAEAREHARGAAIFVRIEDSCESETVEHGKDEVRLPQYGVPGGLWKIFPESFAHRIDEWLALPDHGGSELGIGARGDHELEPRREARPLEHPPEQVDRHARPAGPRQPLREELLNLLIAAPQKALDRGDDEGGLGRVVIDLCSAGDARPLRDLGGARPSIADGDERLDRRLEESRACLLASFVLEASAALGGPNHALEELPHLSVHVQVCFYSADPNCLDSFERNWPVETGRLVFGQRRILRLNVSRRLSQLSSPEGYPIHDAVAVAELVRPGLLTTEYVNVVVECSSELSRGRTVVDRSGRSGREPNARVAVDVDTAAFVRLLIERLRTLG